MKREAELREALALEKADLIRRRNMTDQQRMEEDKRMGRFDAKEKAKWNFLQKYYHKGVFYMDNDSIATDDVRTRDYSAPTLEDKYKREALPSVLQVKNFGKRGRTKYTHLADQDTTWGGHKTFQSGEFGGGEKMGVGTGVSLGPRREDSGVEGNGDMAIALNEVNRHHNGILRPHDSIKAKMESKLAGVHGDLDTAGRLKKKPKL